MLLLSDPYRSFRVHPYMKHTMKIISVLVLISIVTEHKSTPAKERLYFSVLSIHKRLTSHREVMRDFNSAESVKSETSFY